MWTIDTNTLTTALVGGTALMLAVYMVNRKKKPANYPPAPPGWPVFGNLLDLKASDVKGPGILDKWANELGDIYSIQLGSYSAIVLNTMETVKEAFLKHSDSTSGRATNVFFFSRVIRNASYGVVMNEGEKWKALRRTAIHSLRDFGMGKKSLEGRIQEEATALVSQLDSFMEKPFDPTLYLHNVFTNVIVSIVFGERYDYDDPKFVTMSRCLIELFQGGGFKNPEMFIPVMTPLMPLTNKNLTKAKNANIQLGKILRETIEDHKEKFNPDDVQSFIDVYLKAELEEEIKDPETEKQMFQTIVDLFFNGSETSASTTRWALLYFINYPDVQAKCQKVIKDVIGQDRMPTGADRSALVYVDATIHEIQRLSNITPYGVLHRAENDFELSGYSIPKDTLIISNLYGVHLDPRHWDNPQKFDPDRWIGPDGKLVKHDAFMPFSVGPRECPGRNLALQEMFIVIVALLQKFTFKAKDPENPPKISGQIGIVHVPYDFEIIAARY